MNCRIRFLRFWLARHVIHFGLWIWPSGIAKQELVTVLKRWGDHVRYVVKQNQINRS